MARASRRRFLKATGSGVAVAMAGCLGSGGGETAGSVTIMQPEGTLHYPFLEAALEQGLFEAEGVDLTVEYRPFPTQAQSITSGEVDTAMVSLLPHLDQFNRGEDLVMFGLDGTLQLVNSLFVRADSEYETVGDLQGDRIGVWSFGSSTVQAFQTLLAEGEGLQLQQDFETTTAAPPALLGLLQDGEVDGIINVSGLSISMAAQPDSFRDIFGLNDRWLDRTGYTLPLTGWFAYADWYEQNTDVAAGLTAGARAATEYWRENTASILEEYGEPANIDSQAKIDVCVEWSNDGEIWAAETSQGYLDATWEFVGLMEEQGFIEAVPERGEVVRNP